MHDDHARMSQTSRPRQAAELRILLIEDNPGDARLIREMVADAAGAVPPRLEHVGRLAEGIELLARRGADVALLDLSLPDAQGIDTFRRLQAAAPGLPIVVLSGLDDETVAVRAVQGGAQDYLVKGHVDGPGLVRAVRYAVERKRLEADRRELERQRDEFFAGVSHDLRTPVAAIKASIEAVLASLPPDLPPALRRLLVNIDLATDELARLVDDLLELARLEAGRVDLRPVECDLRDVVRGAARRIEPLAQQRGQRLRLDLPAEPVLARVDPERLGRAFGNLVANAHHYGRADGTIGLGVRAGPSDAVVSVSDDGPGIPPAEHGRIFNRFYRSSTTAARREGTGLGLPIARGLVELHGGRIVVDSAPGAGATFHVVLPNASTARA
jgi:phosphoserine phosphatase RsbU/P